MQKVAEQRSISELCALYELEPKIRDVYVEGPIDKSVVRWYLRQRVSANFAVYEIDTVDVPSSLVQQHNFDVGSKGRLLALAGELTKTLHVSAKKCIVLVADADFDYATNIQRRSDVLVVTV